MLENHLADLSKVRFDSAVQALKAAQKNLDILSEYEVAANRSYYAVFYAMRAVFALKNQDFKRHSGVLSNFCKDYIKTKVFDSRLSDIANTAFFVRTKCDYEDGYVISKADVREQVDNAAFFLQEVKKYLLEKGVAIPEEN